MLAYIRVRPEAEAQPPAETPASRRRKLEQDERHGPLSCAHKRARESLSSEDLLAVQASLSEARRRAQRPLSPHELYSSWCERNWRLEDVLGSERVVGPNDEMRAAARTALEGGGGSGKEPPVAVV